jgi:tRNA(adenine34) deaminase
MRDALTEARLAPMTGDVPVAALIFDADGKRIATGRNEREKNQDPTVRQRSPRGTGT